MSMAKHRIKITFTIISLAPDFTWKHIVCGVEEDELRQMKSVLNENPA